MTYTDVRQKQTDQFRKEYRKMVLWKRVSAAAAALVISAMAAVPSFAETFTTDEGAVFTGAEVSSSARVRAAVDYHIFTQPEGSLFTGSGQCWGYAERVRALLGSGGTQKTWQIPITVNNLQKVLQGCRAGTHLRITSAKTPARSTRQHSVVVYKCTDSTIYWSNGNEDNQNHVYYHVMSVEEFCSWCTGIGFQYIQFVIQPTGTGSVNKAEIGVCSDPKTGRIDVAWPSVRGAKKYILYRSTKKGSGYRQAAVTKKQEYADSEAAYGKRTYYRLKAVCRRGSSMSSVRSAVRKLPAPVVTTSVDSSTSEMTASWKPVPGAVKYIIYLAEDNRVFGMGFNTLNKAAETTDTTWAVPNDGHSTYYSYQVCAVGPDSHMISAKTGFSIDIGDDDDDYEVEID